MIGKNKIGVLPGVIDIRIARAKRRYYMDAMDVFMELGDAIRLDEKRQREAAELMHTFLTGSPALGMVNHFDHDPNRDPAGTHHHLPVCTAKGTPGVGKQTRFSDRLAAILGDYADQGGEAGHE